MVKRTRKKPVRLLLPAPSVHSGARIFALSYWLRFKRFATPMHLALLAAGVYFVLSTAFTASFFVPHNVAFSFADSNCFTSPTLLPNFVSKDQGETFNATPQPAISIAGYPLYSHTTCVMPAQAPEEKITEAISFRPLGVGFLKKSINVSVGALPAVDYGQTLSKPVSTKDPLVLPLTTSDKVFDYQLIVNGTVLACSKTDDAVTCDVSKLGLVQSMNYDFTLERVFEGKLHEVLFTQTVATVGAVQVASSTIAAGSTVYDVPTEMSVTFNKEVKSFEGLVLSQISGETRTKVPVSTSTSGPTITVRFSEPLARNASLELTVEQIVAPDGGHLPAPLVLPFVTSGGPKVKGVSIGSYKVAATSNITLTFDSAVSPGQNLASFIKLEINGNAVAANLSRSGSSVTINPDEALPKCTRFTVRVLDGLQNEHGIAGGSAWSYNSRVTCQTTFGIGTSVQGRSITAYRFGGGSSVVVFVGTTHGDEKSSTHTLNSWIDYLERNYDNIPAHRTIVVIPNLNPDAYAASKRTNANNVDLNRNFPANNWKQGVTMPGGSFNPNGGGNAPLSEPESSALADYVLGVNPRLVLTYHSAAGVVMPNDAGDSDGLAKTYDQKSNLYYEPASQTGNIFAYDTTGSFEEWLYDKHGIPAILVELWTKSSNEFAKNQSAMWHMATLP